MCTCFLLSMILYILNEAWYGAWEEPPVPPSTNYLERWFNQRCFILIKGSLVILSYKYISFFPDRISIDNRSFSGGGGLPGGGRRAWPFPGGAIGQFFFQIDWSFISWKDKGKILKYPYHYLHKWFLAHTIIGSGPHLKFLVTGSSYFLTIGSGTFNSS